MGVGAGVKPPRRTGSPHLHGVGRPLIQAGDDPGGEKTSLQQFAVQCKYIYVLVKCHDDVNGGLRVKKKSGL